MWAPAKIANPDYYVDETPLKNMGKIGGAAIEIWTMDEGYFFSNIYIGSDAEQAASYREKYWTPKKGVEVMRFTQCLPCCLGRDAWPLLCSYVLTVCCCLCLNPLSCQPVVKHCGSALQGL